jgi:hypothetical protein
VKIDVNKLLQNNQLDGWFLVSITLGKNPISKKNWNFFRSIFCDKTNKDPKKTHHSGKYVVIRITRVKWGISFKI